MNLVMEQFKKEIAIAKKVLRLFKPKPSLTVSQLADRYRVLSADAGSPNPGRWRTSKTPYLKAIMDAANDVLVEIIVVQSGSQIGKSEAILNFILYYSFYEPSPILLVQPTGDTMESFSKNRVATMIRDTPVLTECFGASISRNSNNTIAHKTFSGGYLVLVGSESPSKLASYPIRTVLLDEVDRYPASAGGEGDPCALAIRRTNNFWNRKIVMVSTPVNKETSRIHKEFLQTDQKYFYVPCPHCDHKQRLLWEQVRYLESDPKSAWYQCINCGDRIENRHKDAMLQRGEWIASAPFTGKSGFQISELYSPWRTFGDVVKGYLESKDDPFRYKTWINTSLGEPFEDEAAETLDFEELANRAEPYEILSVPNDGYFLTAGVDVQRDKLVIVVRAWGKNEESWLVYYQEIWGDPFTEEPWEQLDEIFNAKYSHESGAELRIRCMAIDSGDGNTQTEVYHYCRSRHSKYFQVIPIKGSSTPNKPIVSGGTNQDFDYKGRKFANSIRLFIVGSDTATAQIHGRLKLKSADERGYYHFPKGLPEQYYLELTSEKLVTELHRGGLREVWRKIPKRRNEVLDCEKYALAAAYNLGINKKQFVFEKEKNFWVTTDGDRDS
jgi:phage terminase large subunit GpA-like protein